MPSYFCDVQTDADSGGRTMRVIALPENTVIIPFRTSLF